MAPATSSTSGRGIWPRRSGLQGSQRKKLAHPTRHVLQHNTKRLYKSCNKALDSVRKRKKPQVTQQVSTKDSINP